VTKRIFRSICIVAISVFLASVVLFMGVLYEYFSNVQRNQLKMQTELAAQGVADEGLAYFEGLNISNYRITWIDTDGTVIYDSKSDSTEMENHLQREEIKQALAEGIGESSRYSVTLMERSLYCAKRLNDGTVLRLSIAQNTILTLILGMAQPICMIFVIALILSLVLANRLSKKIVKPLNELNLDEPMKNEGYDELTPLLRRLESQQRQIRIQSLELEQRQKEFLLDVTEKEKSEQMRREFTANVSHELKTPLHTISGCAELLSNGMVKQEDITEFSTRIYTEAQRMIRLVEDIIRLSHLDEGATDLKREEVDLYALADDTIQILSQEADEAKIQMHLEGENAVVYGIPQLLQGIIYNLCDNAIKYNREGGSVTVSVKNEEHQVQLSVVDTGIGIPAEHQERIFERFYRVDKSHSKEIGGTGLGLSIVKHAARLHDASIKVHSVVDGGTTIVVSFPKDTNASEGRLQWRFPKE
jgi:two-component system phosphate regulon sensor histidine kinase PhoR